jgi:peptidoglycan/xylan/chitin deacetylase (PgdA/CDA1 family)
MARADGHTPGGHARPLAAISFDVEPFDIAAEYGLAVGVDDQYAVGREGLARAAALLSERRAVATFFVTACFARRYPADVRALADAGHEVASHGLTHGELGPGDLERSRAVLEEIAGVPVRGFRRARMAPTDPVGVARAGYVYDASENPIWMPGRYNRFFAPRRARAVRTPAGTVAVIPASATPLVRVPLFWLAFKNLPGPVIRAATRWCLRADGQMNTYFHPWELCDLSGHALPQLVRRIDGDRLRGRLGRYIDWLGARAELTTYDRLAAGVLAGHAAPPARADRARPGCAPQPLEVNG